MTTTPPRRAVDGAAAATMLLLCSIWGAQQVAIKLAAPDLAPIYQVSLRSGLSALLLVAFTLWRREPLAHRGTLWPGVLAGALFAGEFLFIAEGLRRTSASHMAVFIYTAPVFTALGLHLTLPSERLRAHQWAGIGLAFAGIAIAFGGGVSSPGGADALTGTSLLGDLLGILAGAAWGATTVVIRTSALSEAPAAVTLLYQLLGAFLVLLPVALLGGQSAAFALTPTSIASLAFQGVIVSFASYLAWFWLLRRYLATGLSVFSFMTPIFGVTFGVLVLGEPLTAAFAVGAALVLAGIVTVSGVGLLRRAAPGPGTGGSRARS
jgi:drug/metabolite transporter (DMT)-like permease